MADIKLVIKIPEESYIALMEIKEALQRSQGFEKFIVNGTLLPKGHGRLIDADAAKCSNCGKFGCENSDICSLYHAQTIIKADGGEVK